MDILVFEAWSVQSILAVISREEAACVASVPAVGVEGGYVRTPVFFYVVEGAGVDAAVGVWGNMVGLAVVG